MGTNFYTYLLSFLIGIAASFIAIIIFAMSQKHRFIKRNEKKFIKLIGKYQHYINNNKIEGSTSEIEFEKPNVLLIKTETLKNHNWEGKIFMNELDSNLGEGYYEYKYSDRNVWGLISLQISRNEKEK